MSRRVIAALILSCSWTASGCVFNALGSRQDDATTTGQGGATSSSVGPGGPGVTSSPSSSASGPSGGGPVCGDGVVEAPETCESGNESFPSCAACTIEHQCGNGVVEPGEACDTATADCTNCAVVAGACFGAEPLPLSLTAVASSSASSLMIPGSFDDTGMCASGGDRSVKLFRFEVGPYPSGLFVSATGDMPPFNDAVVWAYAGCTSASTTCNDVDPDPPVVGTMPNAALLALPLQPPGSVIFVAVGAKTANQSGAFHFVAAPTRFFADFENQSEGFNVGAGWSFTPQSVTAINPLGDAILESPDIDVVGLNQLQIAIYGAAPTGVKGHVIVVPDGGAPLPFVAVPDTGGAITERSVTQAIVAGTKSARVRLVLPPGPGTWEVHRLLVGPKTL